MKWMEYVGKAMSCQDWTVEGGPWRDQRVDDREQSASGREAEVKGHCGHVSVGRNDSGVVSARGFLLDIGSCDS